MGIQAHTTSRNRPVPRKATFTSQHTREMPVQPSQESRTHSRRSRETMALSEARDRNRSQASKKGTANPSQPGRATKTARQPKPTRANHIQTAAI